MAPFVSVNMLFIDNKVIDHTPQNFKYLGSTLYLELLENKEKVIPELRYKDYEPPSVEDRKYDRYKQQMINQDLENREIEFRNNMSLIDDVADEYGGHRDRSGSLDSGAGGDDNDYIMIKEASSPRVGGGGDGALGSSSFSRVPSSSPARHIPRVSDLQNRNGIKNDIVDVGAVYTNPGAERTHETRQERKRDIMFKFEILRKSYPNADIPVLPKFAELEELEDIYSDTLKKLRLDNNIQYMRKIIAYFCVFVEKTCSYFFSMDMDGFTGFHLQCDYDKLLVELGEKNYMSDRFNWPVEVRLVLSFTMNSAIFFAMRKFDGLKIFTSFLGSMPKSTSNNSTDTGGGMGMGHDATTTSMGGCGFGASSGGGGEYEHDEDDDAGDGGGRKFEFMRVPGESIGRMRGPTY